MDFSDFYDNAFDEDCPFLHNIRRNFILLMKDESNVNPQEYIAVLHRFRRFVTMLIGSRTDLPTIIKENYVIALHEVVMFLQRLSTKFENYKSAGNEE